MRVIGKTIFNMVMEKKLGLMDQSMKDNTTKVKSMVMVYTAGMMDQDMKETGTRIKLEVSEFIHG